ncbi:hypothetical protein TrST_g10656 [Triparma strigata]|uniref:Uncharacterized protein n=1 Tax=Triparma strigata TaxID=1606541 RepID=A0A9W7EEM6_9STRA|nr:hypothetical protein TrST_g10656 [Triparma strigata]
MNRVNALTRSRFLLLLFLLFPKLWLLRSMSTSSVSIKSSKAAAIKSAITYFTIPPSNGLFEIELPLTQQLNKAGSGSLQDSLEIEDLNIQFAQELKTQLRKSSGMDVVMMCPAGSSIKNAKWIYHRKPLTNGGLVSGHLLNEGEGFKVVNAEGDRVIKVFKDEDIIVKNSNTPDLREAVKLAQVDMDDRINRGK